MFYFLKQHSRKDWTTDCVILNTCIYFTRHITRTRYLSITPTCKKHAKLPLHCLTKPSITSSSHWWERNNLWFTMNVEESHIFTTTFHYWNWTFWWENRIKTVALRNHVILYNSWKAYFSQELWQIPTFWLYMLSEGDVTWGMTSV